MTREEKDLLIGGAIRQLAGDDRFQMFMDAIRQMRQSALRAAASDAALSNLGSAAAGMGEVRAYLDIEDLVEEHALK